MVLEYIIKDNKYSNIKEIAKEHFEMSERLIVKLKNKQLIFKNKIKSYINEPVKINDIITFDLDYNEENSNIISTKMNLNILYEDNALLIVDKSPFIAIHPSIGHFSDSLSNGIKYYFEQKKINKKIRPVNRLDKDTSGIVIFAKNEYVQEYLIKQMKKDLFKKTYLGIIEGCFEKNSGIINFPISRKNGSIIEREVNKNGQISITHFKTLKKFNYSTLNNSYKNSNYSLVEFKLETGRTHQIRVHSAYLGHSLLGDTLYGNSSNYINRQALHCYKLEFIHPITKENFSIVSNLPKDMQKLLK